MAHQRLTKIVCLGGGIGTVNLIKGLKEYFQNITVVVSMADDGGSTGRLRRLYNILPPGDLVSCMAALCEDEAIAKLITYRFPGNRQGKDEDLVGHKLGNLIMVGMRDITGSFDDGIALFKKVFKIHGRFFPATAMPVSISAKTVEGRQVNREENIDLGRYIGKKELERVYLHPEDAKPSPGVVEAIEAADVIIAGPGDLYTTILPTLIVPGIAKAIIKSEKKRIFILNVANKPSETKGYSIADFINAVERHLGLFPFSLIVANDNFSVKIPRRLRYEYVDLTPLNRRMLQKITVVTSDLVNEDIPIYHNPKKLAKELKKYI